MGDREDELRRSVASDRVASRVLAAMTAEKMAKVRLFEEGIKEQLRLRGWLLDDRARCLEEIDRVKAETERVKAETERVKAELGVAGPAVNGRAGAGAGAGWRPCRRYMIRATSPIIDLHWARQAITHVARRPHRSMDRRPPLIRPNTLRSRTM